MDSEKKREPMNNPVAETTGYHKEKDSIAPRSGDWTPQGGFSPCGVRCWECRAFPEECAGCRSLKGEVSWAVYVDAAICPIYACASYEKNLDNCGLCPELPCSLHTEMRDPELPLEEHLEGVRERMRALRQFNAAADQ